MGKVLFSILVCLFTFFCADEVKAHRLPVEKKQTLLVGKEYHKALSGGIPAGPCAIAQKVKRMLTASRCCQPAKYVSNNGVALSFFMAGSRQRQQSSSCFAVAKSNHLFHLYPFHNFW